MGPAALGHRGRDAWGQTCHMPGRVGSRTGLQSILVLRTLLILRTLAFDLHFVALAFDFLAALRRQKFHIREITKKVDP